MPYRILLLGWRVITDALPTKDKLHQHHIVSDMMCTFCNEEPETIHHIMMKCPFAKAVWFDLDVDLKINYCYFDNITQWLTYWIEKWKSFFSHFGSPK